MSICSKCGRQIQNKQALRVHEAACKSKEANSSFEVTKAEEEPKEAYNSLKKSKLTEEDFMGGEETESKETPKEEEEPNYCEDCGKVLSSRSKYCPGCGIELDWNAIEED